ncbi:MAG: hypothetical protein LBB94_12495 [Clostridiales bacterium]|jgi:predicted nuclease of restriction endonuclease-like (RecB) superfamily|nr:hypothetical protein [Clostridiales bacterium]
MIATRLIERQGKAVNNFDAALSSPDSDYAREIFKDPYLFDYIGMTKELPENLKSSLPTIEEIEREYAIGLPLCSTLR